MAVHTERVTLIVRWPRREFGVWAGLDDFKLSGLMALCSAEARSRNDATSLHLWISQLLI